MYIYLFNTSKVKDYMLRFLFLPLCIIFYISGFCQNVTLVEDPQLEEALHRHLSLVKGKKTVNVYRVQVLVTSDRRQLEQEMRNLRKFFPDYYSSWHFKMPFYHLQLGVFSNKLEAYRFLQQVKSEGFSGALVIEEEMNREEFERNYLLK